MNFLEAFEQGGLVMWFILLCSVAALTEILLCLYMMRRRVVLNEKLVAVAQGSGDAADPERAEAICQAHGGPFAEVLLAVLVTRRFSREDAEPIVEGAGRRANHMLARGLVVLEVVAAIAPLLGLFGTVLGIYEMFGELSQSGIKPTTFSAGIAKALVTTVFGLTVAIPAIVCHGYFTHRVDDLLISIERYAVAMMLRLRSNAASTAGTWQI